MTKQAERIQAAIDNRLGMLDTSIGVEEAQALSDEIKELKSEICSECGGEGTVTGSYFKSNPNLISPPEIDCPTCGGTGVK